jgi:protein-S-isoprenylcysteine O-methyltransferase Ste14
MTDKTASFGERGEWYVAAQFVLLGLIAAVPFTAWHWPLIPGDAGSAIRVTGLMMLLIGLGVVNVGLLSLGWNNLTALPYPRRRAEFVGEGAYRYVRHPIYSGVLLSAAGWALLANDLLSLLLTAVLFLLLDRKAHREEKWLRAKYPAYADYQKRVHKLIPWLY